MQSAAVRAGAAVAGAGVIVAGLGGCGIPGFDEKTPVLSDSSSVQNLPDTTFTSSDGQLHGARADAQKVIGDCEAQFNTHLKVTLPSDANLYDAVEGTRLDFTKVGPASLKDIQDIYVSQAREGLASCDAAGISALMNPEFKELASNGDPRSADQTRVLSIENKSQSSSGFWADEGPNAQAIESTARAAFKARVDPLVANLPSIQELSSDKRGALADEGVLLSAEMVECAANRDCDTGWYDRQISSDDRQIDRDNAEINRITNTAMDYVMNQMKVS